MHLEIYFLTSLSKLQKFPILLRRKNLKVFNMFSSTGVSAKLALLQNFGIRAGQCGFANVPM